MEYVWSNRNNVYSFDVVHKLLTKISWMQQLRRDYCVITKIKKYSVSSSSDEQEPRHAPLDSALWRRSNINMCFFIEIIKINHKTTKHIIVYRI